MKDSDNRGKAGEGVNGVSDGAQRSVNTYISMRRLQFGFAGYLIAGKRLECREPSGVVDSDTDRAA